MKNFYVLISFLWSAVMLAARATSIKTFKDFPGVWKSSQRSIITRSYISKQVYYQMIKVTPAVCNDGDGESDPFKITLKQL